MSSPDFNYQQMSAPFTYIGSSTKAALLIHGFLASPYIMRSIGKTLHTAGYTVQSICLPGHGTTPNDLRKVSAEAWQKSVDDALTALQKNHKEVIIVGFSLGAILGLIAAFKYKVNDLILFSPAFKITRMARLFQFFSYTHLTWFLPQLFCTQSEKINLGSYTHFPVHGVVEVQKIIDQYYKMLKQQKVLPRVYIAASTEDATVDFAGVIDAMHDYKDQHSRFRIYTNDPFQLDPRSYGHNKEVINTYQFYHVIGFSHVAIPVSPEDPYFGEHGSYYGKLPENTKFGEPTWHDRGKPIKRLTFNPDYTAMTQDILKWLENKNPGNINDSKAYEPMLK